MSTGYPPWVDLMMQQITMAVVVRKKVPVVPDSCPECTLVRKCFAFEPSERPTADMLARTMNPQSNAPLQTVIAFADKVDELTAELRRKDQEICVLRARLSMPPPPPSSPPPPPIKGSIVVGVDASNDAEEALPMSLPVRIAMVDDPRCVPAYSTAA